MVDLAYILAPSHSGTTLLAMLLGAHREVCTVGELKATFLGDESRYRCSCGELIQQCAFWRSVRDEMARRGFDFDITRAGTDFRSVPSAYARRLLRPLHRTRLVESARDAALSLSPTWRRHAPVVKRRNVALIAALSAVTGKRVIVDSSKVGIRLKYLLRSTELNIKVIRVIRDGRGVALTYVDPGRFADAQDPSQRGGGSGSSNGQVRLSIEDAAREWLRSNEEAEQVLDQVPAPQKTEVRYEALCRDSRSVVKGLFRFLEVDPGGYVEDFRSVPHHVVGNGMRLDEESEIRLDERWRSVLTETQLATFNRVAGEMNRRLGYQ